MGEITARKNAEDALRESEEQLRFVTDHVPVFIVHCDAQQRFKFVNAPYAERFGLSRAEVVGRRIPEIVGETAYESFRQHVETALRGERVEFEAEIPYEKIGRRWMHCVYVPKWEPDGSVSGFAAVLQDVTTRRSAEDALRESEERLTAVVEHLTEGLIISDATGNVIHWNPAALAMHGCTDLAECQRMLPDFADTFELMTSDGSRVLRFEEWPLPRIYKGEVLRGYEVRVRRLDRDWTRIFSYAGSMVQSASGEHLAFLSITDITAPKAAEVALRESGERFHTLADNISQLAWMADPGGWIFWYNQRWFEYTGTTFEEMQGWGWEKVHHPEHIARVVEKWQRHLRAGESWEDTFPLRGKDGQYRWFLSRALPIRDAEGKIVRWFGTNTDVTERKHAEEELRVSEEMFSTAFSNNPAAIALSRFEDGVVFDVNDTWLAMTGESREGIIGRSGRHMWPRPEEARRFLNELLEKGRLHGWEQTFRRKSGELFVTQISAQLLQMRGEKVILTTLVDITERKRAEEALRAAKEQAEDASRAKDNFLAALSHELRTPLTPVLMTAASLRDDKRLPADVRESLAMIARNVTLEARLIDDLLDLTRIVRGKLPLRNELCDAHSLVAYAVEIIRDEAQEKRIALDLELAARRSGLSGDPARLQQVFWNLLKNAVKFTPVGGHIAIKSRDSNGSLELEIRDTGIGFHPTDIARIFQPFEQGRQPADQSAGGLGLGLAIARSIVELHGGIIRAESAGPGSGASFVVQLPGAGEPPQQAVETDATSAALGTESGSLRLLVVEDHEPTLAVLARLLSRAGHRVTTATSVSAALAAAGTCEWDAVVSDIGLPDGTGLELMIRLRALCPSLRGVALSGYGMDEDLRRSREAGFVAHLIKPVDFEQLRRALRQLAAP